MFCSLVGCQGCCASAGQGVGCGLAGSVALFGAVRMWFAESTTLLFWEAENASSVCFQQAHGRDNSPSICLVIAASRLSQPSVERLDRT